MKRIATVSAISCLICAMGFGQAGAQTAVSATGSAAATAASASSGRPSSIQIRQQFFNQEQAYLERQLREVQRCIKTASLNVVLFDPRGNINRVPQTDLVNCRRRLAQLTRQVNSLARRAQQLGQEAQAQALKLQREALAEQTAQNLRAINSTGGQ